MKTAYHIIAGAFNKLGQLGETESLTSYQIAKGVSNLISMAQAFTSYGLPPWNLATHSIPLNLFASDATLVVGSSGLSLVPAYSAFTHYPVKINAAWRQKDGVRQEVKVLSRKDFIGQPNRTFSSAPDYLIWEPMTYRRIQLSLYPLISSEWSSGTLVVDYQYNDTPNDYTTPTTQYPDYPDYWEEALIYNLAVRLAPEYGLSLEDRNILKQEANQALELALSNSTNDSESIYIQPIVRQ